MPRTPHDTAEGRRLAEDAARTRNWKRWGPYLSGRQWGTVREDYSANGDSWNSFSREQAPHRAYRWGEDGLLGFCDRECRLCFSIVLWNGRDPILKERLFGLTNAEGNHGEDVKELYYFLDATPTHSYLRALYRYPQAEFPYKRLLEENRRRDLTMPEFELLDTGIFAENRYCDVVLEVAKRDENDLLIRITLSNRGPEKATLHLLPTLWFRNTWSWGEIPDETTQKPSLVLESAGRVRAQHETLGDYLFAYEGDANPLFTENETNNALLFHSANASPFAKDAFQERVVSDKGEAVNPAPRGTKFAAYSVHELAPGQERTLRFVLRARTSADPFSAFDETFARRRREADEFYDAILPLDAEAKNIARQASAGLLWTKNFYNYEVREWLNGDPAPPRPPAERFSGRNHEWKHLFARDVISMPDTWEYPWFAAWDLGFQMIPFAKLDPDFAKRQLELLLREWYMHPDGQLPAYEYGFGDVDPPVQAWAAWRVYKMTAPRGERDVAFLEGVFQKLLLNFTWWVNRKDSSGNNIFAGGFLGLDNIGVFDRSKPLPTGGELQQADGTAWMAFYSLTMLSIAMELAETNRVYEDLASKFFEHFVGIAEAMNTIGGDGLWDEVDGFYYDQLKVDDHTFPLRTRSLVGLLPLIAVEVIEEERIQKLGGFKKRMDWFLANRKSLHESISYCELCPGGDRRMLALPSRERLERSLRYMLDEGEFFSPFGVRSVSRFHLEHPYSFSVDGVDYRVGYVPGASDSRLFGGNSNWRGPIWFPINYLLVEALERYHHFYGDDFTIECPRGSGQMLNLKQVATELSRRLTNIFRPDQDGHRPCHGGEEKYAHEWRELVLFNEYFHGDTGRGLGASHQTGWTALVAKLLENTAVFPED
ncbi:MAG: glucosidase [Verrucomicrobiota bacterium]|nr:glucosidase [Verrucomicrobiota bacterium]